ncbi:MAG: class I SAM-dependent methyltransferase [Actinomycetota bacterium]
MEAERHWSDQLAAWAIPPEILEQASEDPWRCPVGLFRSRPSTGSPGPSQLRAKEALPAGGSVLDVGCGGGGASMPLADRATHLTGADENAGMLAAFAEAADRAGVAHAEHHGRWPEVAAQVPPADVVVCHHVFYNVPDLADFAIALTEHARSRVVVELTDTHPQMTNNYLWRHFWNVERSEGPTADDAVAVLNEIGLEVEIERFTRPPRWNLDDDRTELIAFIRRNLCLAPGREPDVERVFDPDRHALDRKAATIWWAGSGS